MHEVTWGSSALCKTWPAWKGCRRDAPSGRSRRLPPGRACNKSGALVSSAGVAVCVSFVLVAAREHLHRPGPDPVPRAQGCACTPCPLRGGLAASALRGGREGGREGSSSAPPAWPAPSPFLQGAAGSAVAVLTSSPEGWSVLPAAGGAALRESAPAWPPAPRPGGPRRLGLGMPEACTSACSRGDPLTDLLARRFCPSGPAGASTASHGASPTRSLPRGSQELSASAVTHSLPRPRGSLVLAAGLGPHELCAHLAHHPHGPAPRLPPFLLPARRWGGPSHPASASRASVPSRGTDEPHPSLPRVKEVSLQFEP